MENYTDEEKNEKKLKKRLALLEKHLPKVKLLDLNKSLKIKKRSVKNQ